MELEVSGFAEALARERGCIPYEGALAVPLFRSRSRITEWTLISEEDRPLAEYNWSLDRWGYIRRRRTGGSDIRMHREVTGLIGAGRKVIADHINRDRADNRRENLRVCTQAQNTQNQTPKTCGSSQSRGVSRKRPGLWQAYGSIGGKMTHLGFFDDEDEAAQAARQWRAENMPFAID